jgi:hypothetical protein
MGAFGTPQLGTSVIGGAGLAAGAGLIAYGMPKDHDGEFFVPRTMPEVAGWTAGGLVLGAAAGWGLGELADHGGHTGLTSSPALVAGGLGAVGAGGIATALVANAQAPYFQRLIDKSGVEALPTSVKVGTVIAATALGGLLAAGIVGTNNR